MLAVMAAPAVVIFLSSNLVNAANLAFNMIFSRVMGPELFGVLALILTIKLAMLGVMGAVQMAVSQVVAGSQGTERFETEQALSRINGLAIVVLVPAMLPLAACLVLAGPVGAGLGLPSPHLLLILVVALPFSASLSILRGAAFGRMMTSRVVLSANVEVAVRLAGALAAWAMGFGLEGVVVAIALSIAAGWAVLAGVLPRPTSTTTAIGPTVRNLALAAAPFGVLQLAQALALDGDIFLARAVLPADEAGHAAALSLFQRIQFFSCFALSSVLLPSVISATRGGGSAITAILPVAALFGIVSVPLLVLAVAKPELLVVLLVGADYLAAASAIWLAALAAVAFTLSYFVATFLVALGDRTGIVVAFAVAVAQLALIAGTGADSVLDFYTIKATCQLAAAVALFLYAGHRVRRHTTGLPL